MKKITYLLLMVSSMAFAQFPTPYCGPMTFTSGIEPITLVNFAGINNASDATVGAVNQAHENFTAMTGNVTAGQSYAITLKGNTDGDYPSRLRVYIDWNQNNVFTDAGESYDIGTIQNSTGVDAIELVGSISVPGTALGGNTRMRVIKKYDSFSDSCNTIGTGWGQSEDYTLSVTAVAACLTGTNNPTAVTVPATCNGFTPTLVATNSYAGDYFYVTVTSGQTYKFTSSVASDYYTLSADDGATAAFSGTQPLTWVSNFAGNLRVHLNTNSTCGTENVDRETNVLCGTVCLEGGMWPTTTFTPATCDGVTVNEVAPDSWAGEYSNIQVYASNSYTFGSSIGTDYLTVANTVGTSALAVGTGSVNYTPSADGVIRVYIHTNSACGTENVDRIRTVVCTSTAAVPDCASNLMPANGSTTVPAFGDIIFTWDAPTSGTPAVSYNIYGGTDPMNLSLFDNVTDLTYNVGSVDTYDFVGYWQIVPVNSAGEAVGCPVYTFTTESQPTDTPDYVNLQWPASITISQGGSDTVYGQVYEGGLTDVSPNIDGQAPGILAWVGVSDVNDNSNPDTWTNWVPMTWNSANQSNNDEYMAAIGASLAPGTYYYATRFTLNDGPFVYGGYTSTGGGFWDGTTNVSGVLTVNPPAAPANDDCSGATVLMLDEATCDGTNTNGTTLGATDSGEAQAACFNYGENDVWFSFTVPANVATVDISTDFLGGTLYDTEIALYSGACDGLIELDCSQDDGIVTQPNGSSWNSLIEDTPVTVGETYFVRVSGYSSSDTGSFCLKISTNQQLSTNTFDNSNFTYYPNPVKNVLNLSYNQNISQVEVYNLMGQKMIANSFDATSAQVDMSSFATGVYLVKVTSNNTTKTIRVIKE